MAHHGERKIVQGPGDGQVPTGRERAFLCAVAADGQVATGLVVKPLLHLRVKAVAVANGVVFAAGQPGAHAVAVHQQQAVVSLQPVVALVFPHASQSLAHRVAQEAGLGVADAVLIGQIKQCR